MQTNSRSTALFHDDIRRNSQYISLCSARSNKQYCVLVSCLHRSRLADAEVLLASGNVCQHCCSGWASLPLSCFDYLWRSQRVYCVRNRTKRGEPISKLPVMLPVRNSAEESARCLMSFRTIHDHGCRQRRSDPISHKYFYYLRQ